MNKFYKINAPIIYIDTYTKGEKLQNSQIITIESKDGNFTTKFNLRYATAKDGKIAISIDSERQHPIWNREEKKEYAYYGKDLADLFDMEEYVPEKKEKAKGAKNETKLLPKK